MAKEAISPVEGQRRKDLVARWETYYQTLSDDAKRDLDNLAKDPYDSAACDKLTAIVSQVLKIQFDDAKRVTFDWLKTKGIKQLTDAMKPGWKQATAATASAAASIGGAILLGVSPIGGFTGATKAGIDMTAGVLTAGGGAGNNVTQMMHSVENSKTEALRFVKDDAQRTTEDLNETRKRYDDMTTRYMEELKRKAQTHTETITNLLNKT